MGVPTEKAEYAVREALEQVRYAIEHETLPGVLIALRDARRALQLAQRAQEKRPFVGMLDETIAYLTEPLPDDLCASSWCGKPRSHAVHMTAEAVAGGIHPSGTHRFTEQEQR